MTMLLWSFGILAILLCGFVFTIMLLIFWLVVAGAAMEISKEKQKEELNAANNQMIKDLLTFTK